MRHVETHRLSEEHLQRHLTDLEAVGVDVEEGVDVGADVVEGADVRRGQGHRIVVGPEVELDRVFVPGMRDVNGALKELVAGHVVVNRKR